MVVCLAGRRDSRVPTHLGLLGTLVAKSCCRLLTDAPSSIGSWSLSSAASVADWQLPRALPLQASYWTSTHAEIRDA